MNGAATKGSRIGSVHVERIVNCPIAAALEYAIDFFTELERNEQVSYVSLPLRTLGLPFPGSITQPVRFHFSIHSDRTEQGRSHEEIAFSWNVGTRWLPDFHGTLHTRIAPRIHTTLILEGHYTPPFSLIGRIFDVLIGHRFAEHTLRYLVDRIGDYIAAQHETFRLAHRG